MKKIYIIGPPGSGKTTLAEKLSKNYNIPNYELDKVAWDDENGNIKRTDKEALRILNEIINKKLWIIEDVGRDKFKVGREKCDIIYYLKLSRLKAHFRVIKRWIKQRLGKERYNYPPTFSQLLYFISTVNSYKKKEKDKLESLKKYKDKLVIVTNNKMINDILNVNNK